MSYDFDSVIERRGTDSVKWAVGDGELLHLLVGIEHLLMRRQQAIVEALYHRHGQYHKPVLMWLEIAEQMVRHVPDDGCLLLDVCAHGDEFLVCHYDTPSPRLSNKVMVTILQSYPYRRIRS